jgi:mannose-1-phosphate guanylyltransferase / mannose-6-phosphate isomerase
MLIPVILSGGAGSRLWPVSREAFPKPFIRLGDGKTLLQKTIERASRLDEVQLIYTVTNREHYFLTKDEFAKCATGLRELFLLEPCGRNTAPAAAMAAFCAVEAYGDDTQVLILPADHLINDQANFRAAVADACKLAEDGTLVTFGITPTRPETGYGYIECGDPLEGRNGYRVKQFVEKPSLERAEKFLSSDRFLWNSGMFCFGARAYLQALRDCAPNVYAAAEACWNATDRSSGEKIDLNPERFAAIEDVSIDYAVMEKSRNVAVVRSTFDWNDIGSWTAVGDLTTADSNGNRLCGETVLVDTHDCYIQSDGRVVAAVGLTDLIVIDTPDALLVSDKSRAQEVKNVVSQLKLRNHPLHQFHRTVHRPWGTFTVLDEGPNHKIKRISVRPKAVLSLQMHHHRSEHWIVVTGRAEVVNGSKQYVVEANESTFIPAGEKHRLANSGSEDLVIIEVQTGSYLGEDDIVRFEDVYGRA